MSLEHVHSDDLVKRWDSLIDDYLNDIKEIRDKIKGIEKRRIELLLIREELLKRKVEVDLPRDDDSAETDA